MVPFALPDVKEPCSILTNPVCPSAERINRLELGNKVILKKTKTKKHHTPRRGGRCGLISKSKSPFSDPIDGDITLISKVVTWEIIPYT